MPPRDCLETFFNVYCILGKNRKKSPFLGPIFEYSPPPPTAKGANLRKQPGGPGDNSEIPPPMEGLHRKRERRPWLWSCDKLTAIRNEVDRAEWRGWRRRVHSSVFLCVIVKRDEKNRIGLLYRVDVVGNRCEFGEWLGEHLHCRGESLQCQLALRTIKTVPFSCYSSFGFSRKFYLTKLNFQFAEHVVESLPRERNACKKKHIQQLYSDQNFTSKPDLFPHQSELSEGICQCLTDESGRLQRMI